jgi:putative transposase
LAFVPRARRIHIPDVSVHVYQRGANRAVTFLDDEDYDKFTSLAVDATKTNDVIVHGFVLMTNHYHMIVTPKDQSSLSSAVHELAGEYSRYHNRKYGRIGPTWNNRYGASLLSDERYFLGCLRYVERNPVNANLVSTPEAYRWSSYRFHASGEPNPWLQFHHLYLILGPTPDARQTAYRALFNAD